MRWRHLLPMIAAMTLLLAVVAYAGLRPYLPTWETAVEPIVIPPNALAIGDVWPEGNICAWYQPPLDPPLPCALTTKK